MVLHGVDSEAGDGEDEEKDDDDEGDGDVLFHFGGREIYIYAILCLAD